MTEISKNAELQQSCITAVKSRFFAQYYGQEILRWHQWIETTPNSKVDLSIPAIEKSGWFIKLKPLSKITDKDAELIAKIISSTIYDSITKEKVSYVKKDIKKDPEVICYASFHTVDKCRQLGYAVQYMEYSVEDLISFGWVQLL